MTLRDLSERTPATAQRLARLHETEATEQDRAQAAHDPRGPDTEAPGPAASAEEACMRELEDMAESDA